MSAAGFFYAGSIGVQWQLLIVVTFLFFSTLAFFSVLFNETADEVLTPILTTNVQEATYDDISYQDYRTASDA
jgi:hypothetical protein